MEGYRGMGWTSEKLCDFLNYIKVNDGSRGKERESEDEDNRTLGGALEKEREKERELGWNRRTRCKLLQAIFVSYV